MTGRAGTGNYHAHALARGITILRGLGASDEPMGLGEMQDATGLPKSTLVRLFSVLEQERLVLRVDDTPRYVLGAGLLELVEPIREGLDSTLLARGYLRRLAHQTGQTANLGVLDGAEVLHLCVEEPDRPIRFRSQTASRDAAYCTGLGKALLAALPADRLESHLPPSEPYPRHGPNTATTREHLLAELRRVRADGVAFDDEERDFGVRCIAMPIPWEGVLAAVSISGPAGELGPESHDRLRRWLADTAEELARDIQLREAVRIVADAMD